MIKICSVCKKEFNAGCPTKAVKRKNCSAKCMSISYKGKPTWNKGIPMREESKKKLSNILKGRKLTIKQKKLRRKIALEKGFGKWMEGKKHSKETREKMSNAHKGKNSSFWKGGITPVNKIIRSSEKYKEWRRNVFKRDNYTCLWCKERGGILNADHIKSFSQFPELRFAIDNGRTLCIECHKKTDSYLRNYPKAKLSTH